MYKDEAKKKKWFRTYKKSLYRRWRQYNLCGLCGRETEVNRDTGKHFSLCRKHRFKRAKDAKNARKRIKNSRVPRSSGRDAGNTYQEESGLCDS